MKTSHSPGPWRIGDAGATVFAAKTSALYRVATITSNPFVSAEQMANARLIAAAPELLDALAGLLANAPAPKGVRRDFSYILFSESAKRAIAKATGSDLSTPSTGGRAGADAISKPEGVK